MIYLLLMLVFLMLFLSVAIFVKKQNYTSPLFINNTVWLIVVIIGFLVYDQYFQLTINIFFLWLLWMIGTNIPFLLLTYPGNLILNNTRNHHIKPLPSYWPIALILGIFLTKDILIVGFSGDNPFLLNLRLTDIHGGGPILFSIMARLYPLVFALFLFETLLNNNNRNKILIYLLMFLYVFKTAGKFAIITPIISYVFIIASSKKIKFKKLFFLTAIVISIMLVLHFYRQATNDTTSLTKVLATYIYSPLIALGEVEPSSNILFGERVFRFIYAFAYSMHISDIKPIDTVLEYSHIPSPVNVYTAIFPYFKDFQELGVIIGATFYGLYFSLLYNGYAKKNLQCLLLYAGTIPILITSFFAEQFFSSLSFVFQLMFYIIIIGYFYEKRKN